jgi:hypothetical protein
VVLAARLPGAALIERLKGVVSVLLPAFVESQLLTPFCTAVVTVKEMGDVPDVALAMLAVCATGAVCPSVYAKLMVVGVTVTLPPVAAVPTVMEMLTT